MALTVSTYARKTRLTTKARVKAELGITAGTDDELIEALIGSASEAIVSHCRRPFAREAYSETLAGYGDVELMLSRTPIALVSSVLYESSPLTDYSIADRGAGTLYREAGWDWTAQALPGLSGRQRFPGFGAAQPRSEGPKFTVSYTAGYFVPDDVLTATTLSASAADNSFNDSAGGFHALLVAGDRITTSGFTQAANNGVWTVVSRTASKVVVSGGTLVTETAGDNETVSYASLPGDIEKACIEAVKSWYLGRADDSNVVEKQVGPSRLRMGEKGGGTVFSVYQGVPPMCVGLLRPWVRTV